MIDIKENAIYALKVGVVVAGGAFIGACIGEAIANLIVNKDSNFEMSEDEIKDMLS